MSFSVLHTSRASDYGLWLRTYNLFLFLNIIKIAACCREAQMKKEANVQRMAEKQKEAKLAVRAVSLKISLFYFCTVLCSKNSTTTSSALKL